MGYSTDFFGSFQVNKPLDMETLAFLQKFNETRRMARNVPKEYGVEGEFYVDGGGSFGQDRDATVIDGNRPPSTQPGLWCQWRPTDDGLSLEWDGNEKFYNYVEWLQYLVDKVFTPRGYTLSGEVEFQGEERGDTGKIVMDGNKVKVLTGKIVFG